MSSIGNGLRMMGSSGMAAFNALKNAKTMVEVINALRPVLLALNSVHDTLNFLYDILSFDINEFKELFDVRNKMNGSGPLGASKITTPLIKIRIPAGGKLGKIFSALGESNIISEFLGEIAAVAIAKSLKFGETPVL